MKRKLEHELNKKLKNNLLLKSRCEKLETQKPDCEVFSDCK
jgi:hypothetical protein